MKQSVQVATEGVKELDRQVSAYQVRLEEVQDGLWNVVYSDTLLGRFEESVNHVPGHFASYPPGCSWHPRPKSA